MPTKPRRFVSSAPMRVELQHQVDATALARISGRMEALADLLAGGAPTRHVVNRLREEAAGIDAAMTGRRAPIIDGCHRERGPQRP